MSKEIRIDAGDNTLICEVEDGKGKCDRYIDPESFVFSTSMAEDKGIEPDDTHEIDRIQGESISVNPEPLKDKIMIQDLSNDQKKDVKELEEVRSKIN